MLRNKGSIGILVLCRSFQIDHFTVGDFVFPAFFLQSNEIIAKPKPGNRQLDYRKLSISAEWI
jgi:hypothetical protein